MGIYERLFYVCNPISVRSKKEKKGQVFRKQRWGGGRQGEYFNSIIIYIYMPEYINKYINSSEKGEGGRFRDSIRVTKGN